MKISKITLSLIIGLSFFTSLNSAHAAGCSLQGVELKCNSEAKTAKAIMASFSSEETRSLLSDPLSQVALFSQNGSLEKYRKSMERNWRAITRLAKQQERNKNRRRISEAEFQTFSKQFEEAKRSYDIALNFYRQLHWQGLK